MGAFYSRLSYSVGNEDWKTEQHALKIMPEDRVLCVTASGDRPLNLLFSDCKEIVAVDANPFQSALFDLKKTAMGSLDYEEYLAFLGVRPHPDRKKVFKAFEKSLTQASALLWNQHLDKISKGILYQGAVEKLLQVTSNVIKTVRKDKVERLFSCSTLEEQREFVDSQWDTRPWKMAFDFVVNPVFAHFFVKDPGLYKNIDASIKVNEYLYNRIHTALKRFPARESIIISLVFQGKLFEEGFSPYLNYEGCQEIRKRLSRLTFHTSDVISYLEKAPENSFDCFSLSDVASYISEQDFVRLSKALIRAGKPGARFCLRQFMSRYAFPKEISSHFKRDMQLENALEQQDRCFLYHFTVGKVLK